MSLAKNISEEIQEDLKTYKQEEEKKTAALRDEKEAQLQELQREYNETIQAQVNEKVNLRSYSSKRDKTFQKTEEIGQYITTAYINAIPRILETTFFKSEIERFLKECPAETTITVSGKYAAELKNYLQKMNHSSIQEGEGKGLGSLTYTTEHTEADFTLEDVVEQVKLATIDKVMQLFTSHD